MKGPEYNCHGRPPMERQRMALMGRVRAAMWGGQPVSHMLDQHFVQIGGSFARHIDNLAGMIVHLDALEWLWRHYSAVSAAAVDAFFCRLMEPLVLQKPPQPQDFRLQKWMEEKRSSIEFWRGRSVWLLIAIAPRWVSTQTDLQALALRNLDCAIRPRWLWLGVTTVLRDLGPNPELDSELLRIAVTKKDEKAVYSFVKTLGADTVRAICLADVGKVLRRAKRPSEKGNLAFILQRIRFARSDFAGIGIPRDRAELWLRAMASAAKSL